MPRKEQFVTTAGLAKESILVLCYYCFEQLNWNTIFADDTRLMANTPKTWNRRGQQVIITADDNGFSISSATTGDELFDIADKNSKNINLFLAQLDAAKNVISAYNDTSKKSFDALRETTKNEIEQETVEAEEMKQIIYAPGGNLYATYGIIVLNTIIFILMAADGAGIMEANGLVHLKWGSNFGPLTLSGDWWRLLTNIFIHFTFTFYRNHPFLKKN